MEAGRISGPRTLIRVESADWRRIRGPQPLNRLLPPHFGSSEANKRPGAAYLPSVRRFIRNKRLRDAYLPPSPRHPRRATLTAPPSPPPHRSRRRKGTFVPCGGTGRLRPLPDPIPISDPGTIAL